MSQANFLESIFATQLYPWGRTMHGEHNRVIPGGRQTPMFNL
jgi:hypothetical protein